MTVKQRMFLRVSVGNVLELAGVGLLVYGVVELVGIAWGMIALAACAIVGAELIYDGTVARIPLPHKPEVKRRVTEYKQRRKMRRAQRDLAAQRKHGVVTVNETRGSVRDVKPMGDT